MRGRRRAGRHRRAPIHIHAGPLQISLQVPEAREACDCICGCCLETRLRNRDTTSERLSAHCTCLIDEEIRRAGSHAREAACVSCAMLASEVVSMIL